MSNKLKEITFNVMNNLKNHEVVLPADYSKTFKAFAKKLNIDIENQEVILEEIGYENEKINKIVNHTEKSLDMLSDSAKSAKEAIEEKDDKKLDSIKADITVLQKEVSLLQKQLFTDSLTNAYNRKWLADNYLNDGKFPNNGYISFIDLNDFKSINDNYGHLVGDMVLRYLADYLKKELDFKYKYIIRYAGDEFIVIFETNTISKDFDIKMEQAQKELSKRVLKPKKIEGVNLSFSFSYGITNYEKDSSFNEILEIIDEKMYINKKMVKAK